MASSTYSFGLESPLKFEISDKTALFYNEAVEKFLKAQVRFNQKFGRQWNPESDPIKIDWSRQQRKAWNDFANLFKDKIEVEGPFHANDIMDDFLVKNVVSVTSVAVDKWGRILSISAAGGALYVLLRGLERHLRA